MSVIPRVTSHFEALAKLPCNKIHTSELLVYQACEEAGPHGQVELFITVMEIVGSDLSSPSLAEVLE